MEELESPAFDLILVSTATNQFSDENQIGHGGLRRWNNSEAGLSKNYGRGLQEFKKEVILFANLQHWNLVKILGSEFKEMKWC